MVKRGIIYLIFTSLLLSNCLEPFEFEKRDDSEKILVIDGQLTTSNGPQYVRISNTTAFGEKFIVPIRNAEVNLITPDAIYNYTENAEGTYVLFDFKGEVGKEYALEVTMPSGKQYQSTPSIMPDGIQADSAYHQFETDIVVSSTGIERLAKVLKVFVNTNIPEANDGENRYMRWFTDELFIFPEESCGGLHQAKSCYVSVPGNPQNITLFNSENIDGSRLEGLQVATKTYMPILHFKTALFFSVYQYGIDKEAYDYWTKLKSLTSQSGTVFDLPPASLSGNIKNIDDPDEQVLGYFELATTDTVRTKVLSSEYKQNVNGIVYCSQFDRRNWPEECCQCAVLEGASTQRPSWLD